MQTIIHEARVVSNFYGDSHSSKTVIPVATMVTPAINTENTDGTLVGDKSFELVKADCAKNDACIEKGNHNAGTNMSIDTIGKIIQRFLVEKQMSKEKLTEILGISVNELDQFLFCEVSPELIQKVNLPLVRLYCETKWS